MSYPYEYTYPANNDAIGYVGPMPIVIGKDKFRNGFTDSIDSRNLIRAAIQRIFMTNPGERVMQPEFGLGLKAMLFEQMDEILLQEIKELIMVKLPRQEPRIIVTNVDFQPDPDNHTIYISLLYKYKNSGIEDAFDFIMK